MKQITCDHCSHPAIMEVEIKKISSQISIKGYFCKHCASQVMEPSMVFNPGDKMMKNDNIYTILTSVDVKKMYNAKILRL